MPLEQGLCYPVCGPVTLTQHPNACSPETTVTTVDPNDPTTWDGRLRFERVRSGLVLVIQDASGCCPWWPTQDLCLPTGSDCTWEITATTGCNPPPHVLTATAALAAEIARECVVTGCLPIEAAGRITRRGVTIDLDPEKRQPNSRLGILEQVFEDHKCQPADFVEYGRLPDEDCWEWHPQGPPVRT